MNTIVQSSNSSLASSQNNQGFNYNTNSSNNNNDFNNSDDVNNTSACNTSQNNDNSSNSNPNFDTPILPMAQSASTTSPQTSPNNTGKLHFLLDSIFAF